MLKKIIAVFSLLCASLAFAAVDVNKATPAELDGVKGIGPSTTTLITTARAKGAFTSWDDFISRVTGIGDARARKLSAEGLTVNGASYTASTTAPKAVTAKPKDVGKEAKDKVTGK